MAKINKYWGYVAVGALTAVAAGDVAALIAKKGSCKEDFDFEDDFDDFDLTTNFTAVAATFNNIGPGLELVGPTGNFGMFSWFSKLILTFDMLAGRLEIFPLLILFVRDTWKKF